MDDSLKLLEPLIKTLAETLGRHFGGQVQWISSPAKHRLRDSGLCLRVDIDSENWRGALTLAQSISALGIREIAKRKRKSPWSEIVVCLEADKAAIAASREYFIRLYELVQNEPIKVFVTLERSIAQFSITAFGFQLAEGVLAVYDEQTVTRQLVRDARDIIVRGPAEIPVTLHSYIGKILDESPIDIDLAPVGGTIELPRGTLITIPDSTLGPLPILNLDMAVMRRSRPDSFAFTYDDPLLFKLSNRDGSGLDLDILQDRSAVPSLDRRGRAICPICWSLHQKRDDSSDASEPSNGQSPGARITFALSDGSNAIEEDVPCPNCFDALTRSDHPILLSTIARVLRTIPGELSDWHLLVAERIRAICRRLDPKFPALAGKEASRIEELEWRLRESISGLKTEDVVGYFRPLLELGRDELAIQHGLHSAFKEYFYLLGLLASTQEPSDPAILDGTKRWHIKLCLESLIEAHVSPYGPGFGEQFDSLRSEQRTLLSAAAFIEGYCNLPAQTTQSAVERLFNTALWQARDLPKLIGMSLKELLLATLHAIRQSPRPPTDGVAALCWAIDLTDSSPPISKYHRLFDLDHHITSPGEVESSIVTRFHDRFGIRRGSHDGPLAFVQQNPAEMKPVFLMPDGVAVYPEPAALLQLLERCIEGTYRGTFRKYLNRRGDLLEYQVERALQLLTPSGYYKDVFLRLGEFQRDFVVVSRVATLCIEAKAVLRKLQRTSMREALFDLRDNFRDGPEFALAQAYDMSKALEDHFTNDHPLYDSEGSQISIEPLQEVRTYVHIAVTSEEYEIMAERPHLLDRSLPPNSVIVAGHEFEFIVDVMNRLQLGVDGLAKFFEQRARFAHLIQADHIYGWLAGFIKGHGTLEPFAVEGGMRFLRGGYEFVNAMQRVLFANDWSEFDEFMEREIPEEALAPMWVASWDAATIVPTEPCPCGSGRTAQECHLAANLAEPAPKDRG